MTFVSLHFMGSRLYDADRTEAEAARVGIARVLPAFAVRNLAFGDLVLLATFKGRRDENGKAPIDGDGKAVRLGIADAWGSFVVSGLNIDAPPGVKAKLFESLHVIRVEEFEEPVEVDRECGSYAISAVAYVRDSIRDIVEMGEAIARDLGVKIKWAITGTAYRPLAPHLSIEEVPFTRTIVKVSLDDWVPWVTPPEAEADGRAIAFIGDYSSRRYRKMTDAERDAANRRRIEAANRGRLLRMKRKLGETSA